MNTLLSRSVLVGVVFMLVTSEATAQFRFAVQNAVGNGGGSGQTNTGVALVSSSGGTSLNETSATAAPFGLISFSAGTSGGLDDPVTGARVASASGSLQIQDISGTEPAFQARLSGQARWNAPSGYTGSVGVSLSVTSATFELTVSGEREVIFERSGGTSGVSLGISPNSYGAFYAAPQYGTPTPTNPTGLLAAGRIGPGSYRIDAVGSISAGTGQGQSSTSTVNQSLIVRLRPLTPTPTIDLASLGARGFLGMGAGAGDYAGHCVSGAGDINGDEVDDFVVGSYLFDAPGRSNAGAAHVIFGRRAASQGAFSPTLDFASLGSSGFRIIGGTALDSIATSVSAAGDVNGDGVGDLLIGSSLIDPNGRTNAGGVYVLFGRRTQTQGAFPAILDLASLGSSGFRIIGVRAGDRAGVAVSKAGDVNGDGVDDIVLGAYLYEQGGLTDRGAAYVVFGRQTATQGAFPSTIDLADPAAVGSAFIRIIGAAAGDRAGFDVAGAGDVNADGVQDLIVGADRADKGTVADTGAAYVVFGRRTAVQGNFPATVDLGALGTLGFSIFGARTGDRTGGGVAGLGDMNGDGIDDVAVSAIEADSTQGVDSGAVHVIFGRSYGFFNVDLSYPINNGLSIQGESEYDEFGSSIASAGDVNSDGVKDLIIGAPLADPMGRNSAGVSYVVFGRRPSINGSFPQTLCACSLGESGVQILGAAQEDQSGYSVSASGDVNGDGTGDLVVGSIFANPNSRADAGTAHVIFGTPWCRADFNRDSGVTIDDFFLFLNAWFTGSPLADVSGNGAGTPTIDDLFLYLNLWFQGC